MTQTSLYDTTPKLELVSLLSALLHQQCVLELLPIRFAYLLDTILADTTTAAHSLPILSKQLREVGCAPLAGSGSGVLTFCFQRNSVVTTCLLTYLLRRVRDVEALLRRQSTPAASPIPDSYNPPLTGEAYYFNEGCRKVRVRPTVYPGLPDPRPGAASVPVAEPDYGMPPCRKKGPHSEHESHFLFTLCPIHGHCYGESLDHAIVFVS